VTLTCSSPNSYKDEQNRLSVCKNEQTACNIESSVTHYDYKATRRAKGRSTIGGADHGLASGMTATLRVTANMADASETTSYDPETNGYTVKADYSGRRNI
jgi:hypothetical protein